MILKFEPKWLDYNTKMEDKMAYRAARQEGLSVAGHARTAVIYCHGFCLSYRDNGNW